MPSRPPQALVLRTAGTNCDQETMHALNLGGARARLRHVREIFESPEQLFHYAILVIPGGFSYGDDVAAGRILANELRLKLGRELQRFIARRRMVVGVCNGFQVLVKAGLLPGLDEPPAQTATLAHNDSGRFQCEWVGLRREPSRASWLSALPARFELPIAHGEGKFEALDAKVLKRIEGNRQVVFRYDRRNPNGSAHSIAGICNPGGNVVGLMPHPERYVTPFQRPDRGARGARARAPGLIFWTALARAAKKAA